MVKKEVGIVTFHAADNYEAVLQAYAFQEYVKRHIGYDVKSLILILQFRDGTSCM